MQCLGLTLSYMNYLVKLNRIDPKHYLRIVFGHLNENYLTENGENGAIIVVLMKNGKMTFSELKKSLALNSSSLSIHLSILQDGGLVNNFLEWKQNSYSYYTITDVTRRVLESLFNIVVQTPRTFITSDSVPTHNISPTALLTAVVHHKIPKHIIESVSRYR